MMMQYPWTLAQPLDGELLSKLYATGVGVRQDTDTNITIFGTTSAMHEAQTLLRELSLTPEQKAALSQEHHTPNE